MNNKSIYILFVMFCSFCSPFSYGQENSVQIESIVDYNDEVKDKTKERAWEVGIGGALVHLPRLFVTDGLRQENGSNKFIYRTLEDYPGINIYLARELTRAFYLDLQGTGGFSTEIINGSKVRYQSFMGGIGLQLRLTPLFKGNWIEPYLRAGVNVFHKNYPIIRSGSFEQASLSNDGSKSYFQWKDKFGNKITEDKNTLFPISLGAGVNAWINTHWGIGAQWEYIMPLHKGQTHFSQTSVKLLYRIGRKEPKAKVVYVQLPPVETIVEKIVEVKVPGDISKKIKEIFGLLQGVNFDFDKSNITAQSNEIIDRAAKILKTLPEEHFLITGFTDIRGGVEYNKGLSRRRANAVVEALESRGVPSGMLKSRGVGKSATSVPYNEHNNIREGDRKVTIELIANDSYWNYLPKKDF